jgi:biotin carboxylase
MTLQLPPGRIVMVGFGKLLLNHLNRHLPRGSVVVVEDPDIIRKRAVLDSVGELACVGSVVSARYHQSVELVAAVEEHLGDEPVALVLPGLEYAVAGAAALAERWGLPGAGTSAAAALTDKLNLRAAARAGGLRNPEWAEVFGPHDVRVFAAGGPVVLKPANRHASLGVQLLDGDADIDEAWKLTVSARDDMMLPDAELHWRYLAERRLRGDEYSAEVLVRDGEILFGNVTAKVTAGGRYPVELGHVVPAELPARIRTQFTTAMADLVAATGFGTGILHAEWMLDDQGPVLIECAARVPGDSIVFLIDAAYGGDLITAMVSLLAGRTPALPQAATMAAAIRFVTADPGTVDAVTGVDEARDLPGTLSVSVTVAPGDNVAQLHSSWDRIGAVMTIGRNAQEAQVRAAEAVAAIRVTVRPGVAA